jgi:hypothetical protein
MREITIFFDMLKIQIYFLPKYFYITYRIDDTIAHMKTRVRMRLRLEPAFLIIFPSKLYKA